MPRHVDRPLPPADELAQSLRDAGADGVPADGDAHARQGLYWMAGYLTENAKSVSFPDFSWDDPRFLATDAKAKIEVAYTPLADLASLHDTLTGALARLRDITLIGLDARASGAKEFELSHALYGRVTLFAWPHKPSEPMDRRIHEAQARGWSRVLKSQNLLPGRGLVVLDEHQGELLRDDAIAARVPGIIVLLAGGAVHLWWNPFCTTLDPEMEHYLAWGHGEGRASEWKEVLRFEGEE